MNIRLARHSGRGRTVGFTAHQTCELAILGCANPPSTTPSNHTPTSLSPAIIAFLLPLCASPHIQCPACYNGLLNVDNVT